MIKKILLLGSGELGKEFVIAAKRLGQYVVAVDSYNNAPAQQVADEREVINMLDGNELDRIVDRHKPDIIVPEIEAIRTEKFYDYESRGIQVVPSARAANFTMNRKSIRDLAAGELKLRTAKYKYASTLDEFRAAVKEIGVPCVAKPLMSSSGKGQSTVRTMDEIEYAWDHAAEKGRGDHAELIIEEYVEFYGEITLLTLTQKNGNTLFCPPIGHLQEHGDYRESWQPAAIRPEHLITAQRMAKKVTDSLTGYGIWGVEFFLADEGVYFSELSPRPHDTGMVTLADTQNLNEFELHLHAVLGLPVQEVVLHRSGASAVILAGDESSAQPSYDGFEQALELPNTGFRVFGKPNTRMLRRMGMAFAFDEIGTNISELRERAKEAAGKIKVNQFKS